MNIGIIGLPQTGKKTLFELLTRAAIGPSDGRKALRGVADVQDDRFDKFVEWYSPKKQSRARVDIVLPHRIEEHAITQGDIFNDLSEVDVFCHVVRVFEDDAVYHESGSIDPRRDIDFVNTEFVLHDLVFVEKRLERLAKDLMKKKDDDGVRERDLLERLKTVLEAERPLRTVELSDDEERIIKSYPLLSRRGMIVVLNVGDDNVQDGALRDELAAKFADDGVKFVQVAVQLEAEIAALETEDERREFMTDMGIEETALTLLTRRCIDALGLMSFFTAGPSEVHQWFVRKDADAVEAAGKIHSDLARGFIRAEVVTYNDLLEYGSEEKVKAAGKLAVKGKDYVVQDGDLLFIRFNV